MHFLVIMYNLQASKSKLKIMTKKLSLPKITLDMVTTFFLPQKLVHRLTGIIWKFLGTDFANMVSTKEFGTEELSLTRKTLPIKNLNYK